MPATATRSDVHRPSFLDPAEYVEVGYVDNHPEQGGAWRNHEVIGDASEFPGNYVSRGRCDHCGAGPLRYAVEFLHRPSNQTVMVGERCAGVLNLSSRTERERRTSIETARRELAMATFRGDPRHDAVYMWLVEQVEENHNHGYGGFYHDLLHKCRRYGSLTENQVAAVERAQARAAEFAARREAEAATVEGPLETGRRMVEGEIVSAKYQESDYGDTMKMLVKQDDGNKVWGTVPGSVYEASLNMDRPGDDLRSRLVGLRVSFTAQVERSNDDEHFGFYKRPTQAQVVEAEAV